MILIRLKMEQVKKKKKNYYRKGFRKFLIFFLFT